MSIVILSDRLKTEKTLTAGAYDEATLDALIQEFE